MSRAAVFLDRDGTLIEDRGHLDRIEMLSVFPWTGDAIRLLNRAGFATVVVTNQSAVARGLIDEAFLDALHGRLDARLAPARIDRYYYCPHYPQVSHPTYGVECDCRKPKAGMIERACRDMDLDPSHSFMVGDRWLDVACGRAAGTRTLMVRTGHGAEEEAAPPEGLATDGILDNLMEAVSWILRGSSPSSAR